MKSIKSLFCILCAIIMALLCVSCTNAEEKSTIKSDESETTASQSTMQEKEQQNNDDKEASKTTSAKKRKSKVLVAYFSCSGNTKRIAGIAAKALNAKLYEIKPETPYTKDDLNYNDLNSRSMKEMRDKTRLPAISGTVKNMEKYDVVFIGYPIWNGEAPRIIDTFVGIYNFSGKTIVPFCTSGSSPIGESANYLQTLCAADSVWKEGRRFSADAEKQEVESWISELELG